MAIKTAASILTLAAVAMAIASPAPARAAAEATAALKKSDGSDIGTVTFSEAPSGLVVKFELKGLAPGPHGVHVHEAGKCDGDFASAGGIYNPLGAKHGFFNEDGPMAGDMANVYAAADGSVVAEFLSPFLSLNKEAEDGLFDDDGTAIIVFEKADDHLSEPEGAAGARIACGAIKAK